MPIEETPNSCSTPRWLLGLLLMSIALVATFSTNVSAVREAFIALRAGSSPPEQSHLTLRAGSSILVTGGAGFVGYHLCERLHRSGVRVLALDNFDPYYSTALKHARQARLEKIGVKIVQGDMCDTDLVTNLLKEHGITHVASMAAQAGVRYSLSHPKVDRT